MAKQPKVLFFARRFYPLIGGVEKHVFEISKRLIKKGFKVTVVTEGYQSLPHIDNIEGIKILRISAGSDGKLKKFKIWFELFKNINLIKSSDIIHCHDVFFWYLPFRFLFPFKKIYTTFHGYEGNNMPSKKSILMHKLAEKLSLKNICVGDYLKKWYGTKPNIVTYGAVEIPKSIKKSKSLKNILYIGRLEEEAGIIEYLKVLKILKQKKYNFNLTVLGDGSQRKKAENFAQENNLNANFKGFVKDVYNFLPGASLVFTSRYLGTLESFVFKKLVICVYNNQIKKDCFAMSPFKDFIILEKNEEKLVGEIIKYYKNQKLIDEKTKKAFDWVKYQTWEKMTDNYLNLWK